MARVLEIERLLNLWGDYRRHAAPKTLPDQAGDDTRASDVVDVDDAVASLPAELQATVREVYITGGPARNHVQRLGCPESTIARRIGRAHLLLTDLLAARREHRRREQARNSWARRLGQ